MAEQLILDLPVRQALGREAFFVSPSNAIALATLDAVDGWPSGKLVLVGPKGAGKTHMAHVWAAEHQAVIVAAAELETADIPALAARRFVVVEDADRLSELPDGKPAQDALFHLHNLTLAEGGRLLVTAQRAPNHWRLDLPDLASRMQGTTVAKIDPPDDMLLTAMLVKQFEDRQIAVPETLIPWLVKRMERSAAAARDIVERLDSEALRLGKPISRSLAGQIFAGDPDQ
ncbi:DnaA ATPase domain-containing protein [Celeribacter neptunius]|uniref:DnaA protein n=1 Tax=Celeribacter neptunius TaxID=588602 RepID=A0A1I3IJA1_9RHOB|nr:DnaA/Hda family protein [Celeribacter neptunius]SFI48026.1 dnaA protein [Celeribacter neptunius]